MLLRNGVTVEVVLIQPQVLLFMKEVCILYRFSAN